MSQVHRFREKAALYIGTKSTGYFTAKEARQIARALYACARSIETEPFAHSTFRSIELPHPTDSCGQKIEKA